MAIFEITEGAPGQGKSLYTARMARRLAHRNMSWFKRGLPLRYVYSNLKFSEKFERAFTFQRLEVTHDEQGEVVFAEYIEDCVLKYWTDTQQICKLHHCDIIWDEIATELDARNYANLTIELKRFLSQYRKRGVDIYANTQDFSMIDARARLMISGCRTLTKIVGSPDPSTTKPVVKNVWGLVIIRAVENYREEKPEKKKYGFIPDFMFIERDLVELYDTSQDIPLGKPAPLKHLELECELGEACKDHYGKPYKLVKHQ